MTAINISENQDSVTIHNNCLLASGTSDAMIDWLTPRTYLGSNGTGIDNQRDPDACDIIFIDGGFESF